jgi:NADH-quinone oxidoreductase subunit J
MGASVFYFVATLSIFFSLMVIFAKNPVHSVLYLIVTFFTFTVHYVLLNLNKDNEQLKSTLIKVVGVIAGCCLLVTLAGALKATAISDPVVLKNPNLGLVKNLGKELFGPFMLPFELCSILLLSAMVGAILLTKKEKV